MDKITDKPLDWLVNQGALGILVIALVFAVCKLWLELKAEREKTAALQEKRIAESRESLVALNANTASMTGLTQVVSILSATRQL